MWEKHKVFDPRYLGAFTSNCHPSRCIQNPHPHNHLIILLLSQPQVSQEIWIFVTHWSENPIFKSFCKCFIATLFLPFDVSQGIVWNQVGG